jgi:hypothetical protein
MVFALEEDRNAEEDYKPEEIVAKLRQVDVLTSQGQSAADAIRSIGGKRSVRAPCRSGLKAFS